MLFRLCPLLFLLLVLWLWLQLHRRRLNLDQTLLTPTLLLANPLYHDVSSTTLWHLRHWFQNQGFHLL